MTLQPAYYLPQPVLDREQKRLNAQHQMLKMTLKGLYPAGAAEHVKRALVPEPGRPCAILDVGTGTGAWAEEMALRFPHAQVLGIDLTPDLRRPLPPNCRFEVGNFDDGFPQYRSKFDVVHGRCLGGGAPNYPQLLSTLASCLRPGGVLLLGEGNAQGMWTWTGSSSSNNNNPAYSKPTSTTSTSKLIAPRAGKNDSPVRGRTFWASRFYDEMVRTIPFKKPDTDKMAELLMGMGTMRGETIGYKRYYAPVGWAGLPEDDLQSGEILGEMMKENVQALFPDLAKLLLRAGFKQDLVDTWLQRAIHEVNDPQSMLYIAWDYGWAVRRT